MRATPVISLVLSLALGVGAIVLARFWLGSGKPEASAQAGVAPVTAVSTPVLPQPPKMKPVLVASRDLKPGETLTPADFKRADWRADDLPEAVFTSRKALEAPEGMVWQVMSAVPQGAPLTEGALALVEPMVLLSRALEPGRRAVSVSVTDVSGVAGFVLVGDRVDVFVTVDNLKLRGGNPVLAKEADVDGVTLSQILVADARVVAVDQTLDPLMQGAVTATTLTLDVPAADAQRLVLAGQTARLAFALRPRPDVDQATVPEAAPGYARLSEIDLLKGAALPGASGIGPERRAPPAPATARPVAPKVADIRIIEGDTETEVTAPVKTSSPTELRP